MSVHAYCHKYHNFYFLSSAQCPADMGSSPELCPAWAPRSLNPSALCFVCTCPRLSPSRVATWAAVDTCPLPQMLHLLNILRGGLNAQKRNLSCLPLRGTRAIFLQFQQRQSHYHRSQQQPSPHLSPVSRHKHFDSANS